MSCFSHAANDFSGGSMVLTFPPNVSISCAVIEIFNDTLVESDEVFSVALLLEANQAFTTLGNSIATVTIIDSDGGMWA